MNSEDLSWIASIRCVGISSDSSYFRRSDLNNGKQIPI